VVAPLLVTQPMILLVFFAARAYCWLMFNLVFTRTPKFFTAKLPSSWSALMEYRWNGVILPQVQDFPFFNFMRFLSL